MLTKLIRKTDSAYDDGVSKWLPRAAVNVENRQIYFPAHVRRVQIQPIN